MDGISVAQYDDRQIFAVSRTEQQVDQLQNALNRDVADRNEHGTSERKRAANLRKSN
jgi:hypothetical protein